MSKPLRILALEPYYGGSHKAFLDGWIAHSCHDWSLLTLPAAKWKWRMRHSAITMAGQVADAVGRGQGWDLLFCSDMLGLAEFIGLAPEAVQALPRIVYFHENQLTYPVEHEREYDYHFAFSNMTSALTADSVWFNSAFHRDSFLTALEEFLRRMPDYSLLDRVGIIRDRSIIKYPGIDVFPARRKRREGPLRILWAARWEQDKDPETFFAALSLLKKRKVDFRLSVIGGGNARAVPDVFAWSRNIFGSQIEKWGYLESREEYVSALFWADVAVSTAKHEFFGITMAEAAGAGGFPLAPNRLAYPEVLGKSLDNGVEAFLYPGGPDKLAESLTRLAGLLSKGDLWQGQPLRGRQAVARFDWQTTAKELDQAAAGQCQLADC